MSAPFSSPSRIVSRNAVLLLAPAFAFVAVFFSFPALYMLRMSFNIHPPTGIYTPAWTLENYYAIFTSIDNLRTIGESILISAVTAGVTVPAAFAFAHFIWVRTGTFRLVLLVIALAPILISEISVIIGWRLTLPRNGLISYLAVASGLSGEKINLLGTNAAAVIGLSYISMPFCVFTILSVLQGLDRSLLTASGDLGASPTKTFFRVLLPLTKAGVISAFIQAFVFSVGIYATTNALGPDALWTISYEVQRQMLSHRNWPLASAFAVVLLVLIVTAVVLLHRLQHRGGARDA